MTRARTSRRREAKSQARCARVVAVGGVASEREERDGEDEPRVVTLEEAAALEGGRWGAASGVATEDTRGTPGASLSAAASACAAAASPRPPRAWRTRGGGPRRKASRAARRGRASGVTASRTRRGPHLGVSERTRDALAERRVFYFLEKASRVTTPRLALAASRVRSACARGNGSAEAPSRSPPPRA